MIQIDTKEIMYPYMYPSCLSYPYSYQLQRIPYQDQLIISRRISSSPFIYPTPNIFLSQNKENTQTKLLGCSQKTVFENVVEKKRPQFEKQKGLQNQVEKIKEEQNQLTLKSFQRKKKKRYMTEKNRYLASRFEQQGFEQSRKLRQILKNKAKKNLKDQMLVEQKQQRKRKRQKQKLQRQRKLKKLKKLSLNHVALPNYNFFSYKSDNSYFIENASIPEINTDHEKLEINRKVTELKRRIIQQ